MIKSQVWHLWIQKVALKPLFIRLERLFNFVAICAIFYHVAVGLISLVLFIIFRILHTVQWEGDNSCSYSLLYCLDDFILQSVFQADIFCFLRFLLSAENAGSISYRLHRTGLLIHSRVLHTGRALWWRLRSRRQWWQNPGKRPPRRIRWLDFSAPLFWNAGP